MKRVHCYGKDDMGYRYDALWAYEEDGEFYHADDADAEIASLTAEVRALRKDRERLDWIFSSIHEAVINVKGPYDWDTVANRYELDAAMSARSGEDAAE